MNLFIEALSGVVKGFGVLPMFVGAELEIGLLFKGLNSSMTPGFFDYVKYAAVPLLLYYLYKKLKGMWQAESR